MKEYISSFHDREDELELTKFFEKTIVKFKADLADQEKNKLFEMYLSEGIDKDEAEVLAYEYAGECPFCTSSNTYFNHYNKSSYGKSCCDCEHQWDF